MNDDQQPVTCLLNLGPKSAAWLAEIGVSTKADLIRLGPAMAYRMVKLRQKSASLNLLYALELALTGTLWNKLSNTTKERLRRAAEAE